MIQNSPSPKVWENPQLSTRELTKMCTEEETTKFQFRFNFMEHELLVRPQTRDLIKTQNKRDNAHKGKPYPLRLYSKMIYQQILGLNPKKFKKKYNIPADDHIRDHLSYDTLKRVQTLEREIAVFIEVFEGTPDETFNKVKQVLQETRNESRN
jgi:hypothetical protein